MKKNATFVSCRINKNVKNVKNVIPDISELSGAYCVVGNKDC